MKNTVYFGIVYICLFAGIAHAQTIRYVKPTATGTGLGNSWVDASGDLQAMINASSGGDQVWVQTGTYYPSRDVTGNASPSDARTKTFLIKSGVKVYGGFLGTETTLVDWQSLQNYENCILSGDLGVAASTLDNAYHVVTFLGANSNTELNGFVIRDGVANGSAFNDKYGGGITCRATPSVVSVPRMTLCKLQNNVASISGGGLYVEDFSVPVITSCQFVSNTSVLGAGTSNGTTDAFNSISYTDCSFIANVATSSGGGAFNGGAIMFYTNCSFINNQAGASGGGGVHNGSNGKITFRNNLFAKNSTTGTGGAINTYTNDNSTTLRLTNCTISENTAFSGGGVAHLAGVSATGTSQLTAVSTIIWNNTATSGAANFLNQTNVAPVFQYADVQDCGSISGCAGGTGNVSVDPAFVTPFSGRLSATSPLINAGDPTATSFSLYPIDPRGLPRVIGGRVDIGAFEDQMTIGFFSRTNGFWNDPNTWECICVPSRSDNVVLRHTVSTTNSADVALARNVLINPNGRYVSGTGATLRMGTRIHYVKPTATGTGDATSWANASGNLQATLLAAQSGEEVWVQQGLYKPTSGTDRTASFSITSGSKVFGGFLGIETTLQERNVNLTFPLTTTLSGNISTTASADNSYHIVWMQNVANGTLLDGFVITGGGTATNTEIPIPPGGYTGGGILNISTGSLTSSPTVQNCYVVNNRGASAGGGMYNSGTGTVTLRNCLFEGNYGENGGAIYNSYSGAEGSETSTIQLNIINCDLVYNSCLQTGKAITGGLLNITNSIVWMNLGGSRPLVFQAYATGSQISYSIIQDGAGSSMYVGGTVSNADPKFRGFPDFRLRSDSPAINTGNPSDTYQKTGFMDLEGNYRIFLGLVDRGCFEFYSTSYQYP
ncbi:right-handed parallel beta-helix repeat-containing protein [Spirosoma sp. BT702]|uniref:Right-handed parallel beta-helix repeat-containing protein n=1 Tax=Spirosoma profusum TaxID=2771354 RepID=A0A926XUP6_9BACT|nr:right-handed parallel beta-helix repeat-containing protein [Spirosoma profusum]MBD2699916.1 right-handed parallel beta-helix repeat-containing protein [Spirosoma profusum]